MMKPINFDNLPDVPEDMLIAPSRAKGIANSNPVLKVGGVKDWVGMKEAFENSTSEVVRNAALGIANNPERKKEKKRD